MWTIWTAAQDADLSRQYASVHRVHRVHLLRPQYRLRAKCWASGSHPPKGGYFWGSSKRPVDSTAQMTSGVNSAALPLTCLRVFL